MDGLVLESGLNVDYFFTKALSAGLFVRGIFPQWGKLYIDYDNRDAAGGSIDLPKGSGGSFWSFGVALDFRFEVG